MNGAIAGVIGCFGQEMTCYDKSGGELGSGMAIVQPMCREEWQRGAGELGSYENGRFLCLAHPLLPVGNGDVSWGGQRYEVMTVRPIRVGDTVTHLWMALRPAEEAGL